MEATKQELKAAFSAVTAVAEAIREAQRIPSGTLYAALMGKMSFEAYQKLISILTNAGLVEERSHELIWVGPEVRA